MKKPLWILLGAILIIALVIWSLQSQQQFTAENKQLHGSFVAKLKKNINDIQRLVISKGDKKFELTVVDGKWLVNGSKGYIAEIEKIRGLLVPLSRSKIIAERTKNPDKYEKIGLDAASRTAVVAYDANGKQLANVAFGSYSYENKGSYALQGEKPTSYIIDQKIQPSISENYWRVSQILNIKAARLASITYNDTMQLQRDRSADNITISGVTIGKKQQLDQDDAADNFRVLEYLNFVDVVRIADVTADAAATTVLASDDGLFITATARQVDSGEYWFSFEVSVNNDLLDNQDDVSVDVIAKNVERITAATAELNTITSGWLYKLAAHQVRRLINLPEKVTKDKPKPKPTDSSAQ